MCSEYLSREPWRSSLVQRLNVPRARFSTPCQRERAQCIAHAIQAPTDLDHTATVVSIDGIGAFDVVSRQAMLEGFLIVEGGDLAMPFVLQFCGSASWYLWEDEEGVGKQKEENKDVGSLLS